MSHQIFCPERDDECYSSSPDAGRDKTLKINYLESLSFDYTAQKRQVWATRLKTDERIQAV
jgi:hypothetical protein